MLAISLDASGLERGADSFGSLLERRMREGLELTLESIAARAKQTKTFVDRTGALRNSIMADGVEGSLSAPDGLVGTVSFGATSERALRKKRGGKRRRMSGGFPYGLSQEYGSSNGVKEKRFIRDAIAAETGDLIEGAVGAAFRDAGFEVSG